MIEPGDQQFAPPPQPPPPGGSGGEGNPWEQRGRLGYGAALFENIKLFVTRPADAYASTLKRGDFLSPLLFSIVLGWLGTIVGQIWQFAFQGSLLSMFPPEMRDQLLPFFVTSPIALAISLALAPVFLTIFLFIWTGIHHVSLMLVGALNNSDAGFEGTFRVNGYAQVAQLAAILPIAGGLIIMVWLVALQTIGASRIHDTTPGRALVGALLPLVACCLCFGLFLVLFGALIMAAFQQG